jgi:hypothetical protein
MCEKRTELFEIIVGIFGHAKSDNNVESLCVLISQNCHM